MAINNLIGYPPTGITPSDVHFVAASVDSFISWGVPDFSTGGVKHGMRTHTDVEGKWIMEAVDMDGVISTVLSIDQDKKVTIPSGVLMNEQASAPAAVAAGEGLFWVQSTAPTTPIFTDDTDTDRGFLLASNIAGWTQGSILFADANGFLIEDNANLSWDDTNDRFTIGVGSFSVNGKAGQENVINESGLDQDTRIEGLNEVNLMFVDASTDRVGFGESSPDTRVHIRHDSGTPLVIQRDHTGGAIGEILTLVNETAGEVGGGLQVDWQLDNAAGGSEIAFRQRVDWRDVTAGAENARLQQLLMVAGATRTIKVVDENSHFHQWFLENAEVARLTGTGLMVGGTSVPIAPGDFRQSSSSAAIPVMALDQSDIDDNFINFIGTSAADATRSISTLTTSGATTHHFRCEINGVQVWIAASTNDPT